MSRYTVYVTPAAIREIKRLPGHVRQRVRRAIGSFAEEPRPSKSKVLDVPGLPAEVRRLRLDRWRILYAITETEMRPSMYSGCESGPRMTTKT